MSITEHDQPQRETEVHRPPRPVAPATLNRDSAINTARSLLMHQNAQFITLSAVEAHNLARCFLRALALPE